LVRSSKDAFKPLEVLQRHRFTSEDSRSSLLNLKARTNFVPRENPMHLSRGGASLVDDILPRLKIGSYFGLWYILNVVYNIVNKKVLNVVPAPLTVGTIQFGIGALYVAFLWITQIRAFPTLTREGKTICCRVGIYHSIGMLLSLISFGAGPISFTHIVKASEPFFSALVSAIVFGIWMKPQVYITLIPVVGGVAYACLNERSFSWLAFWTALTSNIVFALRAVMSKAAMINNIGNNMSSVNLFGIVTWIAFLVSIPIAIFGEGMSFLDLWKDIGMNKNHLLVALFTSGIFHYLNNEVMYLALGNVHPVTLAVGNTLKRVVIMVVSLIVFQNPITLQATIGCTVGILGVLLYSLTKQFYERQDARFRKDAISGSLAGNKGHTH